MTPLAELQPGGVIDAWSVGHFIVVQVAAVETVEMRGYWSVTVQPRPGAKTGEPSQTIAEAAGAEYAVCQSIRDDLWVFFYPADAKVKVAC